MAYHGPSYGLSRECAMKSQAKFSIERAQASLSWLEAVIEKKVEIPNDEIKDQYDFGTVLKDGILLCELINKLNPGSVKKINTLNTPFKHRENIELYLKGCENYGIKPQDLFQVNDLYENKNLYMIVDNLFVIGGLAQKKGYEGPVIGAKMATSNKRNFDDDVLKAGQNVIGPQYGSNKGASQAGMTAYGTGRQIRPDEIGQN
uniref:Calponin-3 n=1 Tax=Lepeophtheirus salmonis TaxID=72036 RepID=D3PJ30_LEPSM|nr:Calponin-3 [Lepeophtheirus salmonis]